MQRTMDQFLALQQRLIAIHNASYKGYAALFWPLLALHIQVHRHTCRQNMIYIKIKNSKYTVL